MAKLSHLSSVFPKRTKIHLFHSAYSKIALCVICVYAETTYKGLKYNISMVPTQIRSQIYQSYNACQKRAKTCYLMVNI